MLYASGYNYRATGNVLGSTKIDYFRPATITMDLEVEEAEASGFPFVPGPIQVVDSAITKETWTITMALQSIDKQTLSWNLDTQYATATPSFPVTKSGVVVAGAITDADIEADQLVWAQVLSNTSPLNLQQIAAAGSPTAVQFEADSGSLGFNTALNGSTIAYTYFKALSSGEVMGGQTASASYGNLSYYGYFKGTRADFEIYIPQMARSGGLSLPLGRSEDTELTYKLTTPAGWNRPWLVRPVAVT